MTKPTPDKKPPSPSRKGKAEAPAKAPLKKPRRRPGESKTSTRRLEAKQRAAEAMTLRIAGASYQVIADRLGFADPSGAQKAIERAMKETIQEPADELRRVELERLDAMFLGLFPHARQGSPNHVEKAIKVMDHRAKLLGLYAPAKVANTNPDGSPAEPPPSLFPDELVVAMAQALIKGGQVPMPSRPAGKPDDSGG